MEENKELQKVKITVSITVSVEDGEEKEIFHHSADNKSDYLDFRFLPNFASDSHSALQYAQRTIEEVSEGIASGSIPSDFQIKKEVL